MLHKVGAPVVIPREITRIIHVLREMFFLDPEYEGKVYVATITFLQYQYVMYIIKNVD